MSGEALKGNSEVFRIASPEMVVTFPGDQINLIPLNSPPWETAQHTSPRVRGFKFRV